MLRKEQEGTPHSTSLGSRGVPREAVVALLSLILQERIDEIKPSYSSELGYHYPDILRVAVRYKVQDSELLEELARMGVVEREYQEQAILCPKCRSHMVAPKLKCPQCGSERLIKTIAVSHVKCGTVNVVEKIEGSACKKCGEPLSKDNVVLLGIMYNCSECGARFEVPHPLFKCRACGALFDHRDAIVLPVYAYKVRKDGIQQALKSLMMMEVKSVAEKMGLTAKLSQAVQGRTGFTHRVDILVTDGKKNISFDIVPESPESMSEVLASVAKAQDMRDDHVVLAPSGLISKLGSQTSNVEGYTSIEDLKTKVAKKLEKLK